jgi:hypothetical protein
VCTTKPWKFNLGLEQRAQAWRHRRKAHHPTGDQFDNTAHRFFTFSLIIVVNLLNRKKRNMTRLARGSVR